MDTLTTTLQGLAAALGTGLLIGIEREKRKNGEDPGGRGAAGVRTFTLTALFGAVGQLAGDLPGMLLAIGVTGLFAAVAYFRSRPEDPGLTTEIALVLTCALGATAPLHPALVAGLGVLVALILASRTWLHGLVRDRLSGQEITDGLLLAGAALVVLPLMPNRTIDPFDVVNPRVVWMLAVLVMIINAAGYVALRAFGTRMGLPIAGLAGGFVSSIATIGSMGSRVREQPKLERAAAAGAVLSSVSTPVNLMIVLSVTYVPLFMLLLPSLIAATVCAAVYGLLFTWRAVKSGDGPAGDLGRAFHPRIAILFAITVTGVIFVSAALAALFGSQGGLLGIAVAGFADSHAPAASGASLMHAGTLSSKTAELAVLLAFTTNSVTKAVAAWMTGGRGFALKVIPGLLLMLAAAWAALFIPLPQLSQ